MGTTATLRQTVLDTRLSLKKPLSDNKTRSTHRPIQGEIKAVKYLAHQVWSSR